ncbi:hypothetical protein GS399_09800 [Pedobacter sp. HMF7647]|uniref:Uncharacterized protein n=1 Tax=Hufsiella arboris TaxID=2695275 RepID=A0A7K1YA73_9SPHI|nr:hypothetical protein [Hufsiella arboris]MXV51261.1 hypothetical protein [Hufsiella arboris]
MGKIYGIKRLCLVVVCGIILFSFGYLDKPVRKPGTAKSITPKLQSDRKNHFQHARNMHAKDTLLSAWD